MPVENSPESPSKKRRLSQQELDKRIERAKYVYEQVNRWIENADSKVATSTGVSFGAFGVITFLAERAPSPDPSAVPMAWAATLHTFGFWGSIVAMLLALGFFTAAVYPNLESSSGCRWARNKRTRNKEARKFPLYYGDISGITRDEFKRRLYGMGDGWFLNGIADDAHINARTCLRKMELYRVGLILSFTAIVLALLSLIARYSMYR